MTNEKMNRGVLGVLAAGLIGTIGVSPAVAGDRECISFDAVGSQTTSLALAALNLIAVDSHLAYTSNSVFGGVQIFDVSNHANPTEIGLLELNTVFPFVFDIEIQDNFAYLAISSTYYGQGMAIFDIHDPGSPIRVGISEEIQMVELEVVGDTVFAMRGFDEAPSLYIYDVTDRSSPALLSSTLLPGDQTGFVEFGLSAIGDRLFVAGGSEGLLIYDVGDLSAPLLLGSYDTEGFALDVEVVGTTAYVADDVEGLKVFDVSDPSSPILTGSYLTADRLRTIEVSDSIVYGKVLNLQEGLLESTGIMAFEVHDSGEITLRGAYHPSEQQARAFTVIDGTLLVTDSNSLGLFDVANTCDAGCIADINGDGLLNFWDVSAFLGAFTAGDPSVDFTGDGAINFFDVSAFLGAFSAGCP